MGKNERKQNGKGGGKMIKCEVIKDFKLEKFDELKNIIRYRESQNQHGMLYLKDTFECTEDMAEYLSGNNKDKYVVVKIIEVIPEEIKKEPAKETEPAIKTVEKKTFKRKKKASK